MKKFMYLIIFLFSDFALAVNTQHFERQNSFGYEYSEDTKIKNGHYKTGKQFIVNLGLSHVENPLTTKSQDNTKKYNSLIDQFNTLHLGLGLRLSESLWINATSAYVFQRNNIKNFGFVGENVKKSTDSFSDTNLKLNWVFYQNKNIGLALVPFVGFPTGEAKNFVGDDGYAFGGLFAFEYLNDYFQLLINLGYKYSSNALYKVSDSSELDYTQRIITTASTLIPLYTGKSGKHYLGMNVEFRRYWMLNHKAKREGPNEMYFGLRSEVNSNLGLFAGVHLGNLFDKEDGNEFRYSGGVKLAFVDVKKRKKIINRSFCDIFAGDQKNNRAVIQFANDKSDSKNSTIKSFDRVIARILKFEKYIKSIVVGGHTSSVGDAKYNKVLSEKRARLVREVMISRGVPKNIIYSYGYGESKLLDQENSLEAHRKNRRTEVHVILRNKYHSKCNSL